MPMRPGLWTPWPDFAEKAGIGMPEVGILKAIPTPCHRSQQNNALVAVSTGLLYNMTREVEAVIGHEVAHYCKMATW